MRYGNSAIQLVESGPWRDFEVDPTQQTGFNLVTSRLNAVRERQLQEASDLWVDFYTRKIDGHLLTEAMSPKSKYAFKELCDRYPTLFFESMTTSDFGSLTDNLLYRTILEEWPKMPQMWRAWCRVKDRIKDFRKLRAYYMDGGEGVFEKVRERQEFDSRSRTQAYKEYGIDKYEAALSYTWEAVINDDLNIFNDMPNILLTGANNSVMKFATQLICDASGPHASLFTAGNGNILTGNPRLSIDTFAKALAFFYNKKDAEGQPLNIRGVTLVVGNGEDLVIANNIKKAIQVEMSGGAGGSVANQLLRVNNWLASEFEVVFNPWIPTVASTANGLTTWFIFGSTTVGRPAAEVGFLDGYGAPALFRRAPNAMRLGGGLDASVGDFNTMTHEYKGLIVFGGAQVLPDATLASNGSGQA